MRAVLLTLVASALGAVACGGSGYVATSPGTPPLALAAKIPGACKVDVEQVFDDRICATPHGPFNLCMSNLRTAFGDILTDVGRKACLGGDASALWVLEVRVPSLTRTYQEGPATGLAAVGREGATEQTQTFVMTVHVEIRDPAGRTVVARDVEVTRETKGFDFDAIGAGLMADATKQLVDVVLQQAAAGWVPADAESPSTH